MRKRIKRAWNWSPATFVLGLAATMLWSVVVIWGQGQNFGGGGGSGTAVVPATGPGKYFVSTNCLALSNCFTVKADIQAVSDATFTSGSSAVATGSSDPPFCNGSSLPCTAAQISAGHTTDVGTVAVGFSNCRATNEMACDANCNQTTIATVVDAHDITLTGTCANNSTATANSNNFYWGSDDSTALTNAWTAAQNYALLTGPATVFLPCGRMGMGTQSFVFVPAGTVHYATGLEGCGEGNPTEIVPFPKMNCTGSNGTAKACLALLVYAQDVLGNFSMTQTARNIIFNGYGLPDKDASATVTTGEAGVYVSQLAELFNVTVQGWMWNRALATQVYGIFNNGGNLYGSNTFAGGDIGLFMQSFGGGQVVGSAHGGSFGGSLGPSIDIGAGETATFGVYINQNLSACFATSPCYGLRNLTSGSNYVSHGDQISFGIWTDVGAKSTIVGSTLTNNGATYSYYMNGGTLALQNVAITGHAHLVSGTVLDLGGNTPLVTYAGLDAFTGGSFTGDSHSIKGICTGIGTAASTLALRISGTSTTGTGIPSTCTSTTLDAGIAVAGARSLGGLMVTSTAAGVNASSGVVTVLRNGAGTTITCTIGTGTSCSDFTHSVTTADGDLISIQFTTQAADTLAGVKAFVEWQ